MQCAVGHAPLRPVDDDRYCGPRAKPLGDDDVVVVVTDPGVLPVVVDDHGVPHGHRFSVEPAPRIRG